MYENALKNIEILPHLHWDDMDVCVAYSLMV